MLAPVNLVLKSLRHALNRLERSDTPLKRKNARLAFTRALRELERAVDGSYRPLRPDGAEVPKARKPRGRMCPYCKVPVRSVTALLVHFRGKHGWWTDNRCKCGRRFTCSKFLVRHLASVKDVGTHLATAELVRVAKGG